MALNIAGIKKKYDEALEGVRNTLSSSVKTFANQVSLGNQNSAYNKFLNRIDPVNFRKNTTDLVVGKPFETLAIGLMGDKKRADYKPIFYNEKDTLKSTAYDVGRGALNTALLTKGLLSPKMVATVAGLNTGISSLANRSVSKGVQDTKQNFPRLIESAGLYSKSNPATDAALRKIGVTKAIPRLAGVGLGNIAEDITLAKLNKEKYTGKQAAVSFLAPAVFEGSFKLSGKTLNLLKDKRVQENVVNALNSVKYRPQHQIDIEKAAKAGDWSKVKSVIDSIPDGDPYKESMRKLFNIRPELINAVANGRLKGGFIDPKAKIGGSDKNLDPLIQEAKKYKSAEEFVNRGENFRQNIDKLIKKARDNFEYNEGASGTKYSKVNIGRANFVRDFKTHSEVQNPKIVQDELIKLGLDPSKNIYIHSFFPDIGKGTGFVREDLLSVLKRLDAKTFTTSGFYKEGDIFFDKLVKDGFLTRVSKPVAQFPALGQKLIGSSDEGLVDSGFNIFNVTDKVKDFKPRLTKEEFFDQAIRGKSGEYEIRKKMGILTKSQLTDIYNQANKVGTSATVEAPNKNGIKLEPLALPKPKGLVEGDGFVMFTKDYQFKNPKVLRSKLPIVTTREIKRPDYGIPTLTESEKLLNARSELINAESEKLINNLSSAPKALPIGKKVGVIGFLPDGSPVYKKGMTPEPKPEPSLQADTLKSMDADIALRIWKLREARIKASPIFEDSYVKGLISKFDNGEQPITEKLATLAEIERVVYGTSTPEGSQLATGSKTGAGIASNFIRKIESEASDIVSSGVTSQNPVVRNTARLLQGFAGGLGKSREAIEGTGAFRGGVDYAQKVAYDTQQYTANLLGKDVKSLERVHAVLDPELATSKISYEELAPNEKEAVNFLRQVSDYINDTNYSNGFISKELWQTHRNGKYIARAYEPYDFPPEIADFLKQSKIKMDMAPFKQRGEVTDWKVENAIRDPAYLVAKRLQQTMFNDEVSRTFKWLSGTDYVSQAPRDGFVQLSDHKAYGDLAGKYVRKDILDDIKGLYFVNDFANKAYDLLRLYDRNPIRQTQKKVLTIFNPAVRLGNNVGNFFFAHLNGINPITFAKNRSWASSEAANNGQLYRRMVKDGLLGTDAMKADMVAFAKKLQVGYNDPNIVKRAIGSLENRYGNADDVAKLAAMKTWLDRGFSYDEAARRVYNGFQNYRTVGWLYDVGSKLPVYGNPFVRFQGDLQRIIKNSLVDHPVRALGTLMLWKLGTDLASQASGETPEDRATREARVGSPRIPFTNTSLEVQTPWGAVNAGRLLGYVAYTPVGGGSVASDLARVSPVQLPSLLDAQRKNNPRLALKDLGSSPDIGPVLSVLADTDFRGKSITDPNQNKYQGSLLTDAEKRKNQVNYLVRQYLPYADDLQDTVSAFKGEKDYYGRTKTPAQALLRAGLGVKVEKFGAEEAQNTRLKDASYKEKANEALDKSINAVKKQLLKGEIDQNTAQKRIEYFNKQKSGKETSNLLGSSIAYAESPISGKYVVNDNVLTYLNDNGDLDNIKLDLGVPLPKQTGNALLDKKRRSNYYRDIGNKINDVVKLNELGVLSDQEAEGLIAQLEEAKANMQYSKGDKKRKKGKKPKTITVRTVKARVPTLTALKSPRSTRKAGRKVRVYKLKVPSIKKSPLPKI